MSTPGSNIGDRKRRHLEICIDAERYQVEAGSTGLEEVFFCHRALPEINYAEIDTTTTFLGRPISMPVLISSMTGGSNQSYRVNKDLAEAAQRMGVPVGMGSIRILFRKPEVMDDFRLKRLAPDVPVLGNIGAVQLTQLSHFKLSELLRELEVDGVAVHLNPGQELFQPEGDRDFTGILDGIRRFCEVSPVPVIVKETGFGIGPAEVQSLFDAGVSYVNVAGSGGTNWITVEASRRADGPDDVERQFREWGTPTGLLLASLGRDRRSIIASGGIRTGMDVAKAVALGAQLAGLALPFVRAVADGGVDGVVEKIEQIRKVLTTVMVLTGARDIPTLRRVPLWFEPDFQRRLRSFRSAVAGQS